MQDLFEIFNKNYDKNRGVIEKALYIVPTPIGNLEDITIRALNILERCDLIICEDTRISGNMLNFYGINNKKLYVYNDHSNEEQRNNVINLLKDDNSVALITDAGTPLISDPGYKLVDECKKQNIRVIPLPGASASITALSASGISSDTFLFYGFLSPKASEKTKELQEILKNKSATICYETANRLLSTLEIINGIDENRKICVAREITKLHEDIKTDNVKNILDYYNNNSEKLKGEIVIIIEKFQDNKHIETSINYDTINIYLKYLSAKDCSNLLSDLYGINKKEIYKKILEVKQNER